MITLTSIKKEKKILGFGVRFCAAHFRIILIYWFGHTDLLNILIGLAYITIRPKTTKIHTCKHTYRLLSLFLSIISRLSSVPVFIEINWPLSHTQPSTTFPASDETRREVANSMAIPCEININKDVPNIPWWAAKGYMYVWEYIAKGEMKMNI